MRLKNRLFSRPIFLVSTDNNHTDNNNTDNTYTREKISNTYH